MLWYQWCQSYGRSITFDVAPNLRRQRSWAMFSLSKLEVWLRCLRIGYEVLPQTSSCNLSNRRVKELAVVITCILKEMKMFEIQRDKFDVQNTECIWTLSMSNVDVEVSITFNKIDYYSSSVTISYCISTSHIDGFYSNHPYHNNLQSHTITNFNQNLDHYPV